MKRPPSYCSLLGAALLFLGAQQTHGWGPGDMHTFNQNAWGDSSTAAGTLLGTNFSAQYSADDIVIGGTSTMTFTSAGAVFDYLPATGPVGVLNGSLQNPMSSSAGEFGGEVLALKINVDFSAAGLLAGTTSLGDLRICGFAAVPAVNNKTVSEFLAIANEILGGGAGPFGPTAATAVANEINGAFVNGTPSTFAQDNLVAGYCPCSQWQNGDMHTFDQASWGDNTSAAGTLLGPNFVNLYHSMLVIGETETITFRNSGAVFFFLPALEPAGVLAGSYLDPQSTEAGELGGEVLGLKLNVDFSEAGLLTSATPLGSLTICNFSALPVLNGQTVNQFLTTANHILGGGTAQFGASAAAAVARLINTAFEDGTPSTFAQNNLVAGTCPGPQTGIPSFVVTTISDHDDGTCTDCDCTLHEAINAANTTAGDNIITFAPTVLGTIQLTSLLPDITTNISIVGPGARLLAVSGNGARRVFNFAGGTTSSGSGLTIANGFVSGVGLGASVSGGGIFNQGNLTLTDCTLSGNLAQGGSAIGGGSGGSGNGGAIYNSSVLAVSRCTFSSNIATGGNGANADTRHAPGNGGSGNGGALFNDTGATLTLTNCTFSGNTGSGGTGGNGNSFGGNGGAGYGGVFNQGTLTVTACTLAGNSGGGALGGSGTSVGLSGTGTGGLAQSSSGGTTTVGNTISAANSASGSNAAEDVSGNFSSSGYNLIGRRRNATGFTATGDQVGQLSSINPQLGTLQNNGGGTNTRALLINSPALDKGKSFGLTTDQRGDGRTLDSAFFANATSGDGTDIGAAEFHPLSGADSDGDGMANDFETFYGVSNPSADADGDGMTNLQEYQAGTNPLDRNSNLRITNVARSGNDFFVTFSLAVVGRNYRLERKAALTDTMWTPVSDFIPASTGSAQVADPSALAAKDFYHILVLP